MTNDELIERARAVVNSRKIAHVALSATSGER